MANISNSKSNTLITGTDSADWIYNSGNSVTIAAKGGNDTVKSTGEYVSINAGEGKDAIIFDDSELAGTQYHAWVSVAGGNNYIKNPVELSTIVTGDGADTIIAGGGTGTNDRFDGYGNYVGYSDKYASIVAGADNNRITVNSYMKEGSITAGDGNDVISIASAENSSINIGNGRNTLIAVNVLHIKGNTFLAGNGSDLVRMSGSDNLIGVGSGRNRVSLTGGQNNTIISGAGNDTISLASSASNNAIVFGGGSDIVYNYHASDTILTAEEITQRTVGNDIILVDGTNKMTLKGAKGKTVNIATLASSSETYKIFDSDRTVGDTVLPSTVIPNPKTKPADIFNETNSTLITGTAYDDTISNEGNNSSINAGTGNDTLNNRGVKVTILGGDGKDIIYGFDNTDILQISGTFSGTYDKSKKEVYFKVGSTANALTLKSFTATTFNVNGDSYKISGSTLKK